jgi:moderate conductance mechanosensitive channel
MEELLSSDYWNKIIEMLVSWFTVTLPSLVLLVILLIVALKVLKLSLNRLSRFTIERAKNIEGKDELEIEKRINTHIGMLRGLGKVIIWIIGIMVLLPKFGIDIKPILAGAGIIGLAVGFGAQELVRDFISGFFMIFENQIRTGDVVIINGTSGSVEKIELRTITLRDFGGVVHVFQNGKVNSLSNMTKEWSAVVFDIGVAYKEDPDFVMLTMSEVGEQLLNDENFSSSILEPIEIVGVDNFADSAVVIKARIKTRPSNQWRIGREYRRRLKISFDEKGIEIPFPHTTIFWGDHINPLNLNVSNETKK